MRDKGRKKHASDGAAYLCDCVEGAGHIEDTFWIARDGFGNSDTSAGFVLLDPSASSLSAWTSGRYSCPEKCLVRGQTHPDLIDMCATSANDNASVLGDDQAPHRDLLGGWFGGGDWGGWD